jgi:hypothetical protein
MEILIPSINLDGSSCQEDSQEEKDSERRAAHIGTSLPSINSNFDLEKLVVKLQQMCTY